MSVVPIDFQDGVNDFDIGVHKSIFFSFVYTPNDPYEYPKVLLNVD